MDYRQMVEIERANAGCFSLTVAINGENVTATYAGFAGHMADEVVMGGATRAEYLQNTCLPRIGLKSKQPVDLVEIIWLNPDLHVAA